MIKIKMCTALAVMLALASAECLWAHGGQYRGPTDIVPPNLGGDNDSVTPPGNPGGPSTPGPGTTGGGTRGPSTGTGPTAPGGSVGGAGRPTTRGGAYARGARVDGYDRWEFWWEHNKEPFLDLKARLDRRGVISDSVGFLTGRGQRDSAVHSRRPTVAEVNEIILPQLLSMLGEKHQDVVDSAALAIGRILRPEDAEVALQPLQGILSHREKTAREAATLALGILGSEASVDPLLHLLNDTAEGRRLTGHGSGVESLVRSFAAAALGLMAAAEAVEDLQRIIDDDRLRAQQDLKTMAILALGLMPEECHDELVPYLLGVMESKHLNRAVRSHAPVSLGRLGLRSPGSVAAHSSLGKVVALLSDDKSDHQLQRSLALCIGMLARTEDIEAIDALVNAIQRSKDEQVRHFAIMGLAQIGARDAQPELAATTHHKIEQFLLKEMVRPQRLSHGPYAALALGVYGRNEQLQGVARRSGEKILEQFHSTHTPSYRAAMAVALGLLNYTTAQDDLWENFLHSRDQALRGYLAISLGLMRATGKAAALRESIQVKGLNAKYRFQLARALGLMGDKEAVPTLVNYLQRADTLAEASASAKALGLIGDRSAIEPLLAVARDTSRQPLQRGLAAVALGILAEKADLPWNTSFSVNANYRAKVPALAEVLDIL
jgi:HEAT repeat protein